MNIINKPIRDIRKRLVFDRILGHSCAGELNKSHLRKRTSHNMQPEIYHEHIAEASQGLKIDHCVIPQLMHATLENLLLVLTLVTPIRGGVFKPSN